MKKQSEKKLKVAVIVKYFYPVAAGIETNIMETYSVLAKKGIEVDIHTSRDTLTEKDVLVDQETIRGLNVKRYPYKWFGYFPQIDYQNIDAVCLHNFNIIPHLYILLYSWYLKQIGKKNFALILTPHGGFNPEWSIFKPLQRIIKQKYHYTVGTYLINLIVDGVRAVSDWENKEMVKKGVKENKVVTIDNGIEDEAYLNLDKLASNEIKSKVKNFGKYFIQIGRIYSIKNYETTIKALSLLPKDINYVIAGPVGSNEYFDKLKTQINKLGLQKRVFFVGVIRGIDKYYMIKKAQMMVHMALWESYCNVVHEGLSQGLVCIVANNTALPLLVKDGVNGYCVETKDYQEVAKKIKYVLDNKKTKFILDMEKRNQKYGLENSWQNVALKMQNFYEKKVSEVRS